MHGHAYSTYTNCIYKVLFGVNAKQLRENLGIGKKDNLRDYLSVEDLKSNSVNGMFGKWTCRLWMGI